MSDANINDVLGRTQREDRAAFDRAQAELTALRKVAEALQVYVADWDSQVSDPRAACRMGACGRLTGWIGRSFSNGRTLQCRARQWSWLPPSPRPHAGRGSDGR